MCLVMFLTISKGVCGCWNISQILILQGHCLAKMKIFSLNWQHKDNSCSNTETHHKQLFTAKFTKLHIIYLVL